MKSLFDLCVWECLLAIFIIIIGSGVSRLKAADLVERLEKSYLSIEDFQANFEQIETNVLLNRVKKTTGIIYSLPLGKIFWHTRHPSPLKVISNGRDVWMFDPKAPQVIHERWEGLDDQTRLALLFLRREGKFKDHFKTFENLKQSKLTLIPKKAIGISKIIVRLFAYPSEKGAEKEPIVANDTHLFFKKITFYFRLERKTDLLLEAVKFNQKLMQKHIQNPIDSSIDRNFGFINPLKTLEKKSK
jgi:outer membrane lipoprotein-sorting protein